MKGLFASLEEMGVEIEGASNVEVEVQPVIHADELETALLDVEEAAQEVATIDDNVSAAVDVAESLESMIESLESALARGGMDNTAASMFQHAMEQYHERLGVKYEPVASLESFDGIATKSSATVASLEGAKEFGKKIWDSIVRAIQWSIDMVKKFFKAIFNARGRLEDRGKEISQRAGSVKHNTTASVKGKYAQALMLDGKMIKGSEATAEIRKVLQETANFDVMVKIAEALSNVSYDADGNITGGKDINQVMEDAGKALGSTGFGQELSEEKKKSLGIQIKEGGKMNRGGYIKGQSLPGNKLVYWMLTWSGSDETNSKITAKAGVGKDSGKLDSIGEKVQAASVEECRAIGKGITEIAKLVSVVKNTVEKNETQKKNIKKRIEALARDYADETVPASHEDDSMKDKFKNKMRHRKVNSGARNALMQVIRTIDQPALSLCQYAMQEGKALADYAEKSLAAHAGQKEDASEGEAAPAAA